MRFKSDFRALENARSLRRQMALRDLLLGRDLPKAAHGKHLHIPDSTRPYLLDLFCVTASEPVRIGYSARELRDCLAKTMNRDQQRLSQAIGAMQFQRSKFQRILVECSRQPYQRRMLPATLQ